MRADFPAWVPAQRIRQQYLSYIPTGEGWLYLAAVKGMATREIVGWGMADHLGAGLACDALLMAIRRRQPPRGLIQHSDRGVRGGFKRSSQHHAEGMLRWRGDGGRTERYGVSCCRPGGRGWRGVRIGGAFGR
jgi:transposase InsO family protein